MPFFLWVSRDLAPSKWKSLAIAIVPFRCAKPPDLICLDSLLPARVEYPQMWVWPQVSLGGLIHKSPADRSTNPSPSTVDLTVFPREGPQIHNRSGAGGVINWFAGDLWIGPCWDGLGRPKHGTVKQHQDGSRILRDIPTFEQWHFYANKAKTEMRHFCLPYWSASCPETPQKRDVRLWSEIGMNLGNSFLPPLT